MIAPICHHEHVKKHGRNRNGTQRVRCLDCGLTFTIENPAPKAKPLGIMRIPVEDAKRVLHLLVEGSSIRSAERLTGMHRDTICRLIVHFGRACQRFLDARMKGLTFEHLEFDEQWTFVFKKQSRLTVTERETCYDMGDIYLWTCIDQRTKLMPSFRVGKRTGDNARRFMLDVAGRLTWPKPHASDSHAFVPGSFKRIVQISTDAFAAYPEAVDLAFGPYVKYGTIIKEYKNATMIYTPSEMVGTKRTVRRGMSEDERFTICTSHIERCNLTVRTFMKRFTRLALGFSKKLECLEWAVTLHMAYYNFAWQPRTLPDRMTPAMAAGLTNGPWTFGELMSQ